MTNPFLAGRRVELETKQGSLLNSFQFKLKGKPITANEIAWPETKAAVGCRASASLAEDRNGQAERPPYMCSITLSPKAEHLISVAPSIRRAKSYVTRLLAIAPFKPFTIKSAASVQPM
jgi:hypothetical protein